MTRNESHENYRQLADTAKTPKGKNNLARKLCLEDLFFLLVYVLGREDCDRDWIYQRIREVEKDPDEHLDLWAREHYKLQRLDEPTATPEGWKLHGELVPGDIIFGADGKQCKVIALNKIVTDAKCYEIEFDDGFKIQAGAEHLWCVEKKTRKRIKGTKNGRIYREDARMQTQEIAQWKHSPDNRLSIPVAPPIFLPDAKLPIHPYVLGAWLGDGTSGTGSITCGDSELFKNIEAFGYELSHNRTPRRNSQLHTIKDLSKWLTLLGLKNNKHIPAIYLRASIEQRLWLLRGLMDTDGHCNTRGTATFTNINKRLIDGVSELCQTLGLKPHTRQYFQTINDQEYPVYTVSFQAYQSFSPYALSRKTERCKKGVRPKQRRFIVGCKQVNSVPMRCIQVDRPDGLYLTGLALLPTHNSTIITFAKTIQDILIDPEITVGIFSHTRPIAKGFLRQIKRELESNKKLYNLFPDILWENAQKQSPKWSEDDGIIVQRKSNPAAATVEAWGLVDGQPVSKHFSLLVYDDVVTRESCTTPEMIAKVNNSWELSLNLGVEGGRKRYIGTRYHYCLIGDSRILMGDFTHKPIKDVQVGESVVGWVLENGRRYLKPSKVINKGKHEQQPVKTYHLDCGRSVTCTETHKWWRGPHGSGDEYKTIGMGYHQMKALRRLLDPTEIAQDRESGWLAGMFDGEGTIRKNTYHPSATISIAQSMHNPGIIDELKRVLDLCGYEYSECWVPAKGKWHKRCNFIINGGWKERYRFLEEIAPARNAKLLQSLYAQLLTSKSNIINITDAGEQDVYWIETETGNYVAEGFCSKNSDTYKLLMDRQAAKPRIHSATIDGTVNGKPVLLHPDVLAQKRREMGPFVFACQMLLDPKADEVQGFKEQWLKYWPCNYFHNFNKIILCDPAGEKKKGSDYTVFWVLGLGEDMNYYAIDIVRDRLSLTERANVLFALHREFRPQFVGYEKYGMQSDIEHFNDRMTRDNYRFGITAFEGKVSKKDRIRSLIPMFEQGRIYIPDRIIKTNYQGITEDMTQTFINEEYLAFPVASHDDMLDCLARITDPLCYREFPIKGAFSAKAQQETDYDPLNYYRGRQQQTTDYDVFAR